MFSEATLEEVSGHRVTGGQGGPRETFSLQLLTMEENSKDAIFTDNLRLDDRISVIFSFISAGH